jgi:DNA-binding CsgD family transcriptional regulator
VALVVCDRAALTTASPVALRKLYGLTPAEQRVVSALVAGASVRDAAGQMGITLNTIRRHLKQIFAKMGVARQSDLVRLVTCGPAMLWFDTVRDAKPLREPCDRRPPRPTPVTSS